MAANISGYDVILQFANLAKATLAGPISNTAVTAQLASGTGAEFPAPTSGYGYVATLIDAGTGLLSEVVLVTEMTGDQVTAMVRAQENTTALNWLAGDYFYMQPTAGTQATFTQNQQANPARIVTSSASFTLSNNDGMVMLNRTTGLAAMNITFPVTPANGQTIKIADAVGNFQSYPVTMIPNSGQSIAGLPGNAKLTQNGWTWGFEFVSTGTNAGIWSMNPAYPSSS